MLNAKVALINLMLELWQWMHQTFFKVIAETILIIIWFKSHAISRVHNKVSKYLIQILSGKSIILLDTDILWKKSIQILYTYIFAMLLHPFFVSIVSMLVLIIVNNTILLQLFRKVYMDFHVMAITFLNMYPRE